MKTLDAMLCFAVKGAALCAAQTMLDLQNVFQAEAIEG